MARTVAAAAAVLAMSRTVAALDNGLAVTPYMGFNSWNLFACNVNETVMRAQMDALATLGLRDMGYRFANIDDCWAGSRAADGSIQADPTSFPSGMAALASYAHARGLFFGLYSSNSPTTCAGRPGSFGYESVDAATYASWGVDFLKYDNCGDQNVIGTPESRYPVMRDALNATGRPIMFAACEWAVDFPATWMAPVANSWRTTYDIQNKWECVVPHVDWTNIYADFAGPGGWSDMDILEVGNGVLTREEEKSHFTLWAAMKSPLLIGCDLTSPSCLAALPVMNNTEVIALNQDPLGKQAKRVWSSGPQGVPVGKSGTCGSEELPQNTILAPCNASDPLQSWTLLPNGTIYMAATGECLQLDSGQGGCCSQGWTVWTNNVASSLCNDPASCCGSRQELWQYDTASRHLISNVSGQCVTVHAGGMHNVGVAPCGGYLSTFQSWDYVPTTGQFISSTSPPGTASPGVKSCMARTNDVQGGAVEVWAGPLAGGDTAVILFNRNMPGPANITATWPMLGLPAGQSMKVRDLWAHTDNGTAVGSVTGTAGVHGVVALRLSPA